MWQVLTTKRKRITDLGEEYLISTPYLERDDGLIVERVGFGRENEETFEFKGHFGEFRFVADRWDHENNQPKNVYWVHWDIGAKPGFDRKLNQKLVLSHAKDVESALLNFPLHRDFESQPVKEVLFAMRLIGNQYEFLHAKDIQI